MSRIRPVERDDLPAIADLYERLARSGSAPAPPGLAASFARQQLDQPWYDDRIRSLLCETSDGRVAGFLAVYARRVVLDGRTLVTACSGPLVADPEVGVVAPGLQLTRAYLAGPQHLSVTDGANEVMRRIWLRVGGVSSPLLSLGWTRVLSPFSFAAAVKAGRNGSTSSAVAQRVGRGLDVLATPAAKRWLAVAPPSTTSEVLTPKSMTGALAEVTAGFRLRPDYDERYLEWLFAELDAIESRGDVSRRLVRNRDGRAIGWSIAFVPQNGIASVLQVAARPDDAGLVLDDLFSSAAERGAVAVTGRLEPHLVQAITDRPCIIRRSDGVLIHSNDPDVVRVALTGESFLSRLDGEWWMAPHLDRFAGGSPAPRLRAAGV
jgi:hypothetical protein